jgi:uncharacterized membrane protein
MVGEFVDEEPIMRVPLTQSLAKTGTFALVHFTVAFGVAFLLTGSAAIAGALALLEPLANTVAFLLHERAWARFTPWRAAAAPTVQQSSVGRSC